MVAERAIELIRDVLRIGQMEPEFCRRELLASNPMAWMISVDGFIVDARTMPPEVQAEARRRGLIPELPAKPAGGTEAHESEGEAHAKGLAEAVRDVIDILRGQPAGSGGPDAWDRIVRTVVGHGSLPEGEVKVIEKAIAEAYGRWSDAERRSIWYETDSGMTDDGDDDASATAVAMPVLLGNGKRRRRSDRATARRAPARALELSGRISRRGAPDDVEDVMLVRERMSRNVVMTTPARPLAEVRATLQRRRVRQLPVVAKSQLVGIVTDRDLRSAGANAFVVADAMSRKVLAIAPTDSVDEAARVLRKRKINALPVVDQGRLVGIITASDVLEAFIDLSGVAESTYRLVIPGAGNATALRGIRAIVARHGGELKWAYVEGRGRRGSIHVRLKVQRLDDLTSALEGAGFEVGAVVATRSPPSSTARRRRSTPRR